MICILLKRKNLTDEQRIKDLKQKFSTFFDEFNDDGIASWLFYFLYIVRRSIIIICYNFIEDYILQISITITTSFIVIINRSFVMLHFLNATKARFAIFTI